MKGREGMSKAKKLSICLFNVILGALFICIALLMLTNRSLRINRSESLPFTLFLSTGLKELIRGEYIVFSHPHYNVALGKQIVGLPGDEISIKDDGAYINGQFLGKIKSISPSGMLLNPIAAGKISEGYVFVFGAHKNSFDSRYAEFGLIKAEWVKEQIWPIF